MASFNFKLRRDITMYRQKKRLESDLTEEKNCHFKMWKSGKLWLYGGAKIVALSAVLIIGSSTFIKPAYAITEASPHQTSQPLARAQTAKAAQTYGVLKWTSETKVSKISGQDLKVMTASDYSAAAPSWMANEQFYKSHTGDKFLITNIGIDDEGDKVSIIATITNSHEDKSHPGGYATKDKTPIIMFKDQGIAKSASGKYNMSNGIAIKQNGSDGAEINYKFVKASDNKTETKVTALSLYADIDAVQAFTTTLLPSTLDSTSMIIGGNSNNAGHPNLTNIGFAKSTDNKPMIYSDYAGDVIQIGDGKVNGYDTDGFGFASNASYWQGTSFDYHFVGNAVSLNKEYFQNKVPTIDKLMSGSKTTFGDYAKSQANTTSVSVFEYDLFGSTNYQPQPVKPIAPSAPQPPADPKLPVAPTAPNPGKYDVPVPKLPAPPTLDAVKNNVDPVKTVTDENGKDVNGQSLSTDKKFNYTITQGIDGKGNEFTNYVAYQKAVTKWKTDCEKLIADYQAAVKDKQGQWDSDNQKVQDYLDAYKQYASNYDSIVKKYNDEYSKYKTEYSKYKTVWESYDAAYQNYVKLGGKEKETPLVPLKEKATIPDKTPQTDITMPDRPVASKIVMPDVPSTNADDYIYTKAAIKDSIDLSKVVLPEGTSTMKVVNKDGKEIKATITREDKDGKANLVATLDTSYVQSDAFYNNSFSLIIGDVLFNIDDQSKQDSEMKATNVATSEVPTPDDEDPKDTNEVDVDPEYSDPGIVKEQSFDGKNWTKDPLNLPEHDNTWQERITHQLSNHADYKTITLKDKWETVKRYESMKVTNFEGKEVEGTTEFLNAAGKDVSKEFKAGTLQKDGKKEQVTILFHVKNPEQFTRAQGDELKLYMTFIGVTTKGASGQEEVNYLDKDDSIKLPDTASTEWTDKTPDDGDKGKGSQTSNTVIDVLPKLDPNLRKFVVTKQEGKHETALDSKGKYKPDYIKDAITTDGDTLVAQKEIKSGEQVTWAIVGTPGNQGLMTQLVDTLPNEFSFDPTSKDAFTAYVLQNDGTLGDEITDHFDYQIKGRVATATPKSAADFFFVGSSTDSRYVILVNTIANENISDGTEFVNHANQTTVNPNNPDKPKDNPSDAKVVTPKQKGTLPLTGSQSRGILTVIGLIMMSIAGFAVWRGKSFKKSEDNEGTSDSTAK